MGNHNVSKINQICEALVLVDADDPRALADLCMQLDELMHWTAETGHAEAGRILRTAHDILERIILEEEAAPADALEQMGQAMAALQMMVCEEQALDCASLPARFQMPLDGNDDDQPADSSKDMAGRISRDETPTATPTPLDADEGLLADFIGEAREHLDASDVQLLVLEVDPTNEEALAAVFRAFHTIKGVAGFLNLTDIGALAHQTETLLDSARKGQLLLQGEVVDVTFDAVDMMKRMVQRVHDALDRGTPLQPDAGMAQLLDRLQSAMQEDTPRPDPRRLGEILTENGSVDSAVVEEMVGRQSEEGGGRRLGQMLVEEKRVEAKTVAAALRAQRGGTGNVAVRDTLKVDSLRLDQLIELIGEFAIIESMVTQSHEIRAFASPEMLRHLSQMEKISREIQEVGTSLRMVPLRSTFQKMARFIRDLSKKLGKEIDFVTKGEDTELDKSVVERIGDPLVHVLRNAMDHGLEGDPQERVQAGKSRAGRVELRAFHRGGNIYIEVADDGRGLDREVILARARERGLVGEHETPSDRDICHLIFHPGFSTAKVVTDVSGRGVGMDVVKRNVEALRGQVDIESQPGKGTVISMRLPLTLAIIDGLTVAVAGERFVVPTLSVVRLLGMADVELQSLLGRGEVINLQDQLIPIVRLRRLFHAHDGDGEHAAGRSVVVVEGDGRRTGLMVDEVIGQQQIVIKSMGEGLGTLPGISGAAILPDGAVGLILDVGGLLRIAGSNEDTMEARETASAIA